jgi:PRTRC genetic system ThiF family protein
MTTSVSYTPHENISDIVLVGCGGTGSQLARTLCRVVYDLRRRRRHIPALHFVDMDRVEEKNVGRQMFTEADIGMYKAEVLARRFNRALGLDITWHAEPFDAERHTRRYGTLLLGCVDNHLARQVLAKARAVWLDSGNYTHGGQVCLGTTADPHEVERGIRSGAYNHLPNAALVFPQLLQPEPAEVLKEVPQSCAELVKSGDQSLLINDLMGIVAGEYVYKLLNREPLTTFITYVSADPLVLRSVLISDIELRQYTV